MFVLNFMVALVLFQTPAPAKTVVVVGLTGGQQLAIDNPQFSGFIETRDPGEPVLVYRQKQFHGEMKLSAIRRIDVNYQKGKPFQLDVTLKNGNKLSVEAAGREFVIVKGTTDTGTVIIKHPDPISSRVRISTKKANRANDLTIQYLEFPQ